uniref:Uncharacterized protein n=1 Tax=Anguilla anguilla TaxID=7936 RepID=A0A0E9P6N6_ANGAN
MVLFSPSCCNKPGAYISPFSLGTRKSRLYHENTGK